MPQGSSLNKEWTLGKAHVYLIQVTYVMCEHAHMHVYVCVWLWVCVHTQFLKLGFQFAQLVQSNNVPFSLWRAWYDCKRISLMLLFRACCSESSLHSFLLSRQGCQLKLSFYSDATLWNQSQLHGCVTSVATQGSVEKVPTLVLNVLTFLITSEQEAPLLHFALGLANIAGPD